MRDWARATDSIGRDMSLKVAVGNMVSGTSPFMVSIEPHINIRERYYHLFENGRSFPSNAITD